MTPGLKQKNSQYMSACSILVWGTTQSTHIRTNFAKVYISKLVLPGIEHPKPTVQTVGPPRTEVVKPRSI